MWLTVLGAAGLTAGSIAMVVDEATASAGGVSLSVWLVGVIGIPLFGLATILGLVRLHSQRRAMRQHSGLRRLTAEQKADSAGTPVSARFVANDAMAESEAVSLSDQWTAEIPVADARPDNGATSPDADGLGPDWANAGAILGLWLSGPIVGSVAFKILNGQPDAWWLVLLWAVGLYAGTSMAWEAWHGHLDGRTLRRSPDKTELSGRTAWPIRRRRSIQLDQLTHVSCRTIAERHGLSTYFILRDHRGGHVMLEDAPDTRNIVLAAVTRHPGAHIGYVASRQLAGMFTWWLYPVALVGTMLFLVGTLLAALATSAAFGATTW